MEEGRREKNGIIKSDIVMGGGIKVHSIWLRGLL